VRISSFSPMAAQKTTAAAAARVPQRRHRVEARCGIAITRRSPFISASTARHAMQRLT
jgi:hypothetical protein